MDLGRASYQRTYQRNVNLNVQVQCAAGLLLAEQSAEGISGTASCPILPSFRQQHEAQGAAAPATAFWA